jgi:hypothetical protein
MTAGQWTPSIAIFRRGEIALDSWRTVRGGAHHR